MAHVALTPKGALPSYLVPVLSGRQMHLIIMPTEACNFRCTYCYEDFSLGRMSESVVARLKRFLRQRIGSIDDLYVSWFGGEPLLAKDIVVDISEHIKEISAGQANLSYRAGITSNAYLLNQSLLGQFAELGIKDWQITLDGPAPIHDRSRVQANGAGTFGRIWQSLMDIRNSSADVKVVLRVHFSEATARCMTPLLDDMKRDILTDRRFSVSFKPISRLGGVNDADIPVMSDKAESHLHGMLNNEVYGDGDAEATEKDPYVCYAGRPNSMVIRSDGTVAKCTVAFADPRNHLGHLQEDGTLFLDQEKLRLWFHGLSSLDTNALACPLGTLPELAPLIGLRS